jgi:hypothetical protein
MNWEALGAIGEIVGAVAVIVTLVYLAIQVRHSSKTLEENTAQLRISSVHDYTVSLAAWQRQIYSSPAMAELWIKGRNDLSQLDEVDRDRFQMLALDFFITFRSGYAVAEAAGHAGQARLAAASVARAVHLYPGFRELWKSLGRQTSELVEPRFVAAVEELVREGFADDWLPLDAHH